MKPISYEVGHRLFFERKVGISDLQFVNIFMLAFNDIDLIAYI